MGRKEKVTQEEIDLWVLEAEWKRAQGKMLTDHEWMLVQYAHPARCGGCGYSHSPQIFVKGESD